MLDDRRIMDLEIKITFQESTIDTLNDVVTEQQNEISKLTDAMGLLKIQMQRIANHGTGEMEIVDTPPPHY